MERVETAIVITVSDSRSSGARPDASGPAVAEILSSAGFLVQAILLIPDDQPLLEAALRRHSEHLRLIVTTGGTGIAPRDITPEATRAVCDRILDGVAEQMRLAGQRDTPFASLSRALCGTRHQTLILNLPGSPKGAVTSLNAVLPLLPHAMRVLAGKESHQDDPELRQTPAQASHSSEAGTR